jgi:hypothetical protein
VFSREVLVSWDSAWLGFEDKVGEITIKTMVVSLCIIEFAFEKDNLFIGKSEFELLVSLRYLCWNIMLYFLFHNEYHFRSRIQPKNVC